MHSWYMNHLTQPCHVTQPRISRRFSFAQWLTIINSQILNKEKASLVNKVIIQVYSSKSLRFFFKCNFLKNLVKEHSGIFTYIRLFSILSKHLYHPNVLMGLICIWNIEQNDQHWCVFSMWVVQYDCWHWEWLK